MKIKVVILCFVIFSFTKANAQLGCPDIQALNFDPLAILNDGSCIYQQTSLSLDFKCFMDGSKLDETSGILKHNNSFWTHVDNTDNSIYRIDDDSDSIFQKITIQNASNQDWEDIASDENYVYIGDVGNNGSNRQNLRFYRISKSYLDSATTSVTASKIKFSYADQTIFNTSQGNYYDCEAFLVLNDSIHLFTKGWSNRWTKHYVIPADTGNHVAQLVDSFNVDGLITSAAIQGDSLVVLLGLNYSNGSKSFVWALSDFKGTDFFSGNKRRFEIGNINTAGQVEAICFSDTNKCYITNEELSATPNQIREIDLSPYLVFRNTTVGISNPVIEQDVHIYPNPFSGSATFSYNLQRTNVVTVEVFNTIGERIETLVHSEMQHSGNHSYSIGGYGAGIYFVRITANGKTFTKRVVSM